MSEARETIFSALRAARPPRAGPPRRVPSPAMPDDPIAVLRERITEAGGHFEAIARSELPDALAREAPVDPRMAAHVYSTIPELASRGAGRKPRTPHDLAPLELCVIEAELTVVESGAAWHAPRSAIERAAVLLAEHLVVLAREETLVATLHQAYERIDLQTTPFGWFLCGPSKTADIEQSLVMGAHGPCSMGLMLIREAQQV